MKSKTIECAECADSIGRFLLAYSSWLLGCGATCIRLEKNVQRIARRFGMTAETIITPRHIQLSISCQNNRDVFSHVVAVHPSPINFTLNTMLSRLSWEIADSELTLDEAKRKFDEIVVAPAGNSDFLPFVVAFANASFCRIFGGDWVAAAIVAAATFAGFCLKQILAARHIDARAIFFICAFVSAVLASAASLFALGTTPALAVGTSVLYLVPGIPFLNSFSDMVYRHYICAFSRLVDAVVLTCCLSAGLGLALMLMNNGGWIC